MAHVNKQILIGHLGKDVEIKVSQSGTKKASFSLATSERFKDKNTGELKDQTEWHNIVAWGTHADRLEKVSLKKGTQIYVEGKTTHRSWDDANGQKKNMTEVVLSDFQILSPKQSVAGGQAPAQEYTAPAYDQAADDMPF